MLFLLGWGALSTVYFAFGFGLLAMLISPWAGVNHPLAIVAFLAILAAWLVATVVAIRRYGLDRW